MLSRNLHGRPIFAGLLDLLMDCICMQMKRTCLIQTDLYGISYLPKVGGSSWPSRSSSPKFFPKPYAIFLPSNFNCPSSPLWNSPYNIAGSCRGPGFDASDSNGLLVFLKTFGWGTAKFISSICGDSEPENDNYHQNPRLIFRNVYVNYAACDVN